MSKHMVTSVALSRMIRPDGDDKDVDPSVELYVMYVYSVDAKINSDSNADDEYRAYYMKHYPTVCGEPPLELPPKRVFDHRIELIPGSEPVAKHASKQASSK